LQSTLSSQYASLLRQHQLASFEQLWNYQGDWFEPPNQERGGWSGVNFLLLADECGTQHGFYLKRQQGHMRRTFKHPLQGEPTFVREFEILKYLNAAEKKVRTPELVFFERQGNQSILLTKALEGFVAADYWFKVHADVSVMQKRRLLKGMAEMVRAMHQAGVQHRALYLKHLFVKTNDQHAEVALIDFEKSRVTRWIAFFKYVDLMKLNHRARWITCTNKLYFFKQYFSIQHLSLLDQYKCRFLNKKSQKI
jgi:tRNA A-37 threonylcarbamoyl transferase component Bud32